MRRGRLVLTICKVHLCTPFILTSILARLVIAYLHWFILAIYSPQGTDAEVIHPWKNLSYSPFFQSCPYLCGNRETEFLSLENPAQKSTSLKPTVMEIYGFANMWGRWPKDDHEEKAEVLKPFLALTCTGTTCSQTSVCTSTIWQGEGQSAVVEQRRDSVGKLDIFQ